MANVSQVFGGIGQALTGASQAFANAEDQRQKAEQHTLQLEQLKTQKDSLELGQAVQRLSFAQRLPVPQRREYFKGSGKTYLQKALGGEVSDEVAEVLATPQGYGQLQNVVNLFPQLAGIPKEQADEFRNILGSDEARRDPAAVLDALDRVQGSANKYLANQKLKAEAEKVGAESVVNSPRGKFLQAKVNRVEDAIKAAQTENPALSRDQIFGQAIRDAGFTNIADYNNAVKEIGGEPVASPAAQPDKRVNPKAFDLEKQLRTEYSREAKDFKEIQSFAGQLVRAIENPGESGVGDVATMFAIMKIFDPGSVVREGEQVLIKRTTNLPEGLAQVARQVFKNGQFFTDKQRLDVLNQGIGALKDRQSQITGFVDTIKNNVDANNLDLNRIISPKEQELLFKDYDALQERVSGTVKKRMAGGKQPSTSVFDDILPEE